MINQRVFQPGDLVMHKGTLKVGTVTSYKDGRSPKVHVLSPPKPGKAPSGGMWFGFELELLVGADLKVD